MVAGPQGSKATGRPSRLLHGCHSSSPVSRGTIARSRGAGASRSQAKARSAMTSTRFRHTDDEDTAVRPFSLCGIFTE